MADRTLAQLLDAILIGEDRELGDQELGASRHAADGSTEPSVSMSSVSLSKSVRCRREPARRCRRHGGRREIESIGITPIGWSGDLFSPRRYRDRADRHVRTRAALSFRASRCGCSVEDLDADGRSMSAAVISPDRRDERGLDLGRVGVHAAGRSPSGEDDVRHVSFNSRDRRRTRARRLDAYARHSGAGQRREQHAAQRVPNV